MTTPKQAEANVRNSINSTGPTSAAGKHNSSGNATTHGLASWQIDIEDHETARRLVEWSQTYPPQGIEEEYQVHQIVMATKRIDECEQALHHLKVATAARARLTWNRDRKHETALLGELLAAHPQTTSLALKTTPHGCDYLLEAWDGLVKTLQSKGEWSEDQITMAFDLLGIDARAREGITVLDPHVGVHFRDHLLNVIDDETESIRAIRDNDCQPLDDVTRSQAMTGMTAYLSRDGKLLMRYIREAHRRYEGALFFMKSRIEARAVAVLDTATLPQPEEVVTPPEPPESPSVEAPESPTITVEELEVLDDKMAERRVRALRAFDNFVSNHAEGRGAQANERVDIRATRDSSKQ